ncbi:MAG: type I DNA topoisomerase [Phocaeicola sp.]|nr:type I DNA topoisomerase [Phocaeicola sp.]MDD7448037.1 type I DNA topoisomerase [Prevotellaceae bacterium]MDY5938782.1 type I DNA topoisomerase [Phocaeicola sp.]
MQHLVIVESPAKAKTIEKFLGKDYKVLSSFGHIRDLKQKSFSIDIEHNFLPLYEVPEEKKKLVSSLKSEAQKATTVWLASDEDREGEAISWHLYEVLGLTPEKTRRIVFHEITKTAILHAIETPRSIDTNLVNAQQARRVLDRIVGFELSPVLWKKIKPSLSAGRVQSVAVRLIVEREREIQQFKVENAYRIVALFIDEAKNIIKAEYPQRFKTEEAATEFLEICKDATFTVAEIVTKPGKRSPAPPFTTSTLQQEASRKLGFSVSQTMMIAQRLYEEGHITYMRTDSVNLSGLALSTSKQAIVELMGEKYAKTRKYTTKAKGAQEAHEAIRPTYMNKETIEGTAQEKKLYDLIWKRTLASQMADAEIEKTTISIDSQDLPHAFQAVGEVITFDGFLRVYKESFDDEEADKEEGENLLPVLQKGQYLNYKEIKATERFTQPQPRYTEASLVRKLEELGIGRPSTYAPTISTIQQRGYVEKGNKEGVERSYTILKLAGKKIGKSVKTEQVGKDKGKLLPTDVGIVVTDYLLSAFPSIMDYNFTASIEKELDEVAEGKKVWETIMATFYTHFHPLVEEAHTVRTAQKVGERILGTDPQTGRQVSVKIARFGPVVQVGTSDEEEKPKYAPITKEFSIENITLEEALGLFNLPRTLGSYEGEDLVIGTGRFGPYIKIGKAYVSIPKQYDPMAITLEEAVQVIEEKKQADAQKLIKDFPEMPSLQVLNGRYGPYISYEKKNYKIIEKIAPQDLSLEDCKRIMEAQQDKPATKKKRAVKKK